MQQQKKTTLEKYYIMIASKYLKSKIDYVNLITTTKKLFDLLDCFHYNPIRVSTTKLFPNMQTQHLYTKNDKLIPDMFKYIAWYTINYNEKDTTIENIEYKNIEFTVTIPSWQNYYYGHDEYYDEQKLNRTIPDGVHSLGRVPQNYFHGIKELTIPNTVRKITENFKFPTTLERVALPPKLVSIGSCCFQNCKRLVEVILPNSLKHIGDGCFMGCDKLCSLTLPPSLEYIGSRALPPSSTLTELKCSSKEPYENVIPYGVALRLEKSGIKCPLRIFTKDDVREWQLSHPENFERGSLKSIVIPNVRYLEDNCFNYKIILNNVTLPTTLVSIGSGCFADCRKLSEINIPTSVLWFGTGSFYGCGKLRNKLGVPKKCWSQFY